MTPVLGYTPSPAINSAAPPWSKTWKMQRSYALRSPVATYRMDNGAWCTGYSSSGTGRGDCADMSAASQEIGGF